MSILIYIFFFALFSLLLLVIVFQIKEQIHKYKLRRPNLSYRNFPRLNVKQHMLSSKIWHFTNIMDEFGFAYHSHKSEEGIIRYQLADVYIDFYLSDMQIKTFIGKNKSYYVKLEHLKDLREEVEHLILEIHNED